MPIQPREPRAPLTEGQKLDLKTDVTRAIERELVIMGHSLTDPALKSALKPVREALDVVETPHGAYVRYGTWSQTSAVPAALAKLVVEDMERVAALAQWPDVVKPVRDRLVTLGVPSAEADELAARHIRRNEDGSVIVHDHRGQRVAETLAIPARRPTADASGSEDIPLEERLAMDRSEHVLEQATRAALAGRSFNSPENIAARESMKDRVAASF